MNKNYPKAYREVIEILKFVPEESVNKIPKEKIEIFKQNMDIDYKFQVDVEKEFKEQNLLEETKDIFALIFRDYWATPYQREKIIAKENYDREIKKQEKRDNYNPNELFKKRKEECEKISDKNLLMEMNEKNIFERLIDFIKRFLHFQ